MWPDNETERDLIGFKVHVDLIRQVVMDQTMLPITLGVFGDWGGGKTSIMKMLERDLSPEAWPEGSEEKNACEKIAVIYLNTWLFEGYNDAKTALLTALLLELGEHKRFGTKLRDGICSLLKSVDYMKLLKLGMKHLALPVGMALATGGLNAGTTAFASALGSASLASPEEEGKSDHGEAESKEGEVNWIEGIKKAPGQKDPLEVRTFRARFSKMLKDSDIESLVVLIDDLDRCTPERIVESLEAIKLFISVDKTAYIIGADQRIVQHAIRAHYSRIDGNQDSKEETEQLVKDYLEKLIQVPYRIPRLSASEIETYMVLLFCQQYLVPSDATKCIEACATFRLSDRYSTFGYAGVKQALGVKDLDPNLAGAIIFCRGTAPLIADCLKGNPRQVKRFLNAVHLRKKLAKAANLNLHDDVLIKLMILEYAHEDLFLSLFDWQAMQKGFPEQIKKLESLAEDGEKFSIELAKPGYNSKWSLSQILQWLKLEPKLSDTDLRDYFWVARDKLNATMTGITMVPPVVRTNFEALLKHPKIDSLIPEITKLTPDELLTLLGLFEQRISLRPKDKKCYDILRTMGEHNIQSALEQLSNILTSRPLDDVPAAVGMDIVTLSNARPEFDHILKPLITHLTSSNSKAGKAAQDAVSRRKS